ncbi:VCBS repeat-containing protein [Algoriphagus confluentis]|uniref:VCBS repeat-containing protein n=1 Tax=Algoriphagus confluentis TaxID=1697556 RepID=A0ABQ6PJX0_9BACT|nr:VCBS repeat-containing protein [Algoriphagus confluentis]
MRSHSVLLLLILLLFSCKKENDTLFVLLDSSKTGLKFRNDLTYTETVNPYTFRNFYNGAGVAIGDLNNDGLPDIFLAGNQTSNRLYLNLGEMKFRDITTEAGLDSEGFWTTGVSMADINGDGLLDLYICKSGPMGGEKRHNELFINQGNLTFLEKSKEFGLAETGLSQHAVFFDYDRDGDLDMYLLSNSGRSVGVYDLRAGQREIRGPEGGNKLFRNDGNQFTDVSEHAGIYGSAIGYGLGVTVADLNEDQWPDLYVSNDFFERDYLYLNNQDGTFSEVLPELLLEISMGSMGADIADLDNDARPDIFVTEMLPATWERIKTKTPFEEWDKYQANVQAGYHHQFTRNTLQRNLGLRPGTQIPVWAEVSRFAGVEATDWSWGALIFDADLDGYKDIFVANGIVKDLTDFDFVDFYVNNQSKIQEFKEDSMLVTQMIDAFPSAPQSNFWFKNLGNWQFENQAEKQGLSAKTFSTGTAYADLDNDGDLDLVINNLNEEAFLYQNQAREQKKGNFLSVDLKQAFGAKVLVYSEGKTFYQEYQPVKGYMSSVDSRVHFGLGKSEVIDSIRIIWPDGAENILSNVQVNQIWKPERQSTSPKTPSTSTNSVPFYHANFELPFTHQESEFVDFDRDRLRFWMISNEGPKVASADVNGDGLKDIFLPGPKGQASQMLLQQASGGFISTQKALFEQDALAEDITAVFFDANGDSFPDLLVGSGGIEHSNFSPTYSDRLYLNNGMGNFTRSSQLFAATPTSFIEVLDWDKDGDQDLIIGERAVPFAYGIPTGLQFWENDGKGNFTDRSADYPELRQLGMLTDGKIADLNGDGMTELVLVGEWMPIRIFTQEGKKWVEKSEEFGFSGTSGLWNCLKIADVNGDGKPDILAGNLGLNSRIRTSSSSPLQLIINDFDQNGSVEQILSRKEASGTLPMVLKNPLLKQIPSLRKQLTTYAAYQNATLEALFPPSVWAKSLTLQADLLATSLWINGSEGQFSQATLPAEIQLSPVYCLEVIQRPDSLPLLVFAGNQSRIKPELGTQMGSYAWVVSLQENGTWKTLLPEESGLFVPGETRSWLQIPIHQKLHLVAFRNDDTPLAFEIR